MTTAADLADVAEGLMFMLSDAGHRVHALKNVVAQLQEDKTETKAEIELARLRIIMGKLTPLLPPEQQERVALMLRGEVSIEESV